MKEARRISSFGVGAHESLSAAFTMAWLVLTILALITTTARSQSLSLTLIGADFNIALDGKPWLAGSDVVLGSHSYSAGSLFASAAQTGSGTDKLGAYNSTSVSVRFTASSQS